MIGDIERFWLRTIVLARFRDGFSIEYPRAVQAAECRGQDEGGVRIQDARFLSELLECTAYDVSARQADGCPGRHQAGRAVVQPGNLLEKFEQIPGADRQCLMRPN